MRGWVVPDSAGSTWNVMRCSVSKPGSSVLQVVEAASEEPAPATSSIDSADLRDHEPFAQPRVLIRRPSVARFLAERAIEMTAEACSAGASPKSSGRERERAR